MSWSFSLAVAVAVVYLALKPPGGLLQRLSVRLGQPTTPVWARAGVPLAAGILIAEWWAPALVLPGAATAYVVGNPLRERWRRTVLTASCWEAAHLAVGAVIGRLA